MKIRFTRFFLICCAVSTLLFVLTGLVSASEPEAVQQLKDRITDATKNFQDITMLGTITYKNEKMLSKIDANYSRLYEFKSANISYKVPDKMRIEGKLGMVRFEYIINGGTKIFRAPAVKVNKKDDYSKDPAKLQDALDIGLITPSLWQNRTVEVVDDAEAAANGEIKLSLHWAKGDMQYLIWLDSKDLWLKKFERRDAKGNLKIRIVYSNPQRVGDVIWMPTVTDVYSTDGEKAGTSQMSNIKVNTGISDTLFQ